MRWGIKFWSLIQDDSTHFRNLLQRVVRKQKCLQAILFSVHNKIITIIYNLSIIYSLIIWQGWGGLRPIPAAYRWEVHQSIVRFKGECTIQPCIVSVQFHFCFKLLASPFHPQAATPWIHCEKAWSLETTRSHTNGKTKRGIGYQNTTNHSWVS